MSYVDDTEDHVGNMLWSTTPRAAPLSNWSWFYRKFFFLIGLKKFNHFPCDQSFQWYKCSNTTRKEDFSLTKNATYAPDKVTVAMGIVIWVSWISNLKNSNMKIHRQILPHFTKVFLFWELFYQISPLSLQPSPIKRFPWVLCFIVMKDKWLRHYPQNMVQINLLFDKYFNWISPLIRKY